MASFHVTDPQFHKDVGFYVFKLPFLTFIVDWTLAILIVTLAVSVVFHYFNGGIQPQRGLPRVRPPVKAHISVLLALIALDKAVGYVLQRWSLVNSQDGYVNGAGYTDVHARLPAETLLIYVSIFAAVILLFNIRRQGWTLPVLAIGIWAFVALVVGIIYPALLQALKVTPAQSSLEAPYIQRNITATRAAYGLNNVQVHQFPADPSITASQTVLAAPTIDNIRQWDPDPSISLQTFQREQAIKGYYAFPSLGVDRYTVSGQVTPVLIGVRDISSANLASPSWVNTHLQYTHGNGAAVALANQNNTSNPVYAVSGVPPTSSNGMPAITQPNVYFGLGETGYVVANTKQLEVDYQKNGTSVESHYKGTGGVQLSSIFTRAAFALRLGDFNLLISSQITDKSRIMFVRDPVSMAQKAAPFLTFDHDPYAVINSSPGPDHGHIDWIVDGYTTTANYPYSQNAGSQQVAIGTNLPGSYNYVRNSVKVVIDAYSGKMTFYDADPKDPILQAYSAAFPNMFVPLSKMPTALQAHLRYPEDIFSIQSAIYGRYHLTNSQAFYSASSAWQLSPTAGAGPQSQALLAENTYNNQGQLVSTTPARMAPQYQVYSLPGTSQNKQVFTVSDGFVPASQSSLTSSGQNFNLTAWMVGLSDPGTSASSTCTRPRKGRPVRPTRTPRSRPIRRCRRTSRCWTRRAPRSCWGRRSWSPSRTPWCTCVRCTCRRSRTRSPSWSTSSRCWARTSRSTPRSRASSRTCWARRCCRRARPDPRPARCRRRWRKSCSRPRPTTPTRRRRSRPATCRSSRRDIDAMQAAISQAQQVIDRHDAERHDGTTTTTTVPPIKPKTPKKGATTTTTSHAATTSSSTTSVPTSTEPKNATTTTTPRRAPPRRPWSRRHPRPEGAAGDPGAETIACPACDSGCSRGRGVP